MATKKLKLDKKTVSKLSQEDLRNIEGGRDTMVRITDRLCPINTMYCPVPTIIPIDEY